MAPLAGLAACTSFEPGTDEVAPPEQTIQRNLELGPNWACLPDEAPLPVPYITAPGSARRIVRSVQLLDLVTSSPIPGLSVRACAQRDLECAEPVTEPLPVGDDGWLDVPLYDGFVGYLEITGESVISTALVYPDPVSGPDPYTQPFALVGRDLLPLLTGAIGTPQSADQGLVALRALDCEQQDARGVRYSIDRPGVPWYFVGGLPSGSATETADSSLGGFLNIAPGIAVVSASLLPSLREIVAPTSVLVRAGWMTVVRFVPAAP